MLLLTSNILPSGMEIAEVLGIVSHVMTVRVQLVALATRIDKNRADNPNNFESDRVSIDVALEELIQKAPFNTNVIYGIQHSITITEIYNISHLYVSVMGTAGRFVQQPVPQISTTTR